jgi:hypothetical protein
MFASSSSRVVLGLECNVAKVIEFCVRDLLPRTVRRTPSTPGRVIEFPSRQKQSPLNGLAAHKKVVIDN